MKALLALVLVAAVVAQDTNGYVRVPGGMMLHQSCVHQVEDGVVVDTDTFPPCAFPAKYDNLQIYAMDVHLSGTLMTNMNASFNVPPLPRQSAGQVVYFWPGFKSTDPTMGLPVLQPVLQYGRDSEGGGSYWCLRSWFVWGNQGQAFVSKELRVAVGDILTSYMSFNSGSSTWTIYGRDTKSSQDTTLTITKQKAGNCDYKVAMLVLETIMPENQCGLLPAAPQKVTFTGVTVNGKVPAWTQRVQMHDCQQALSVTGDSTVMTWKN